MFFLVREKSSSYHGNTQLFFTLHGMPFLSFKTQLKSCLLCKAFLTLPSRQYWSFCQSFCCVLCLSYHLSHNHVTIILWYNSYLYAFFLINYQPLEDTDFHIHFYNPNSWHTEGTKMMFCASVIQIHVLSYMDHCSSILTRFPTFSISCLGYILYFVNSLIF